MNQKHQRRIMKTFPKGNKKTKITKIKMKAEVTSLNYNGISLKFSIVLVMDYSKKIGRAHV